MGLRADYEQAAKRRDYFYDVEAAEQLQAFINDCDRKIEVAKKKLKETQQELGEDALAKGTYLFLFYFQDMLTIFE